MHELSNIKIKPEQIRKFVRIGKLKKKNFTLVTLNRLLGKSTLQIVHCNAIK